MNKHLRKAKTTSTALSYNFSAKIIVIDLLSQKMSPSLFGVSSPFGNSDLVLGQVKSARGDQSSFGTMETIFKIVLRISWKNFKLIKRNIAENAM